MKPVGIILPKLQRERPKRIPPPRLRAGGAAALKALSQGLPQALQLASIPDGAGLKGYALAKAALPVPFSPIV